MRHTQRLTIMFKINPDGMTQRALGRAGWALKQLVAAGQAGCTPITHPGPRWAHYVYLLRRMGLIIETIHEPHAGDFPGTHARYLLKSDVVLIADSSCDELRGIAA